MWNFAGMCVNADQGRLRISLGAIGDQTQAEFLPNLPGYSGFKATANVHHGLAAGPVHSHSIVSGTYKPLKRLESLAKRIPTYRQIYRQIIPLGGDRRR